ncbi:hypothetical protein OG455_23420 [Kitasatospora sp. NBC_01287]|uniref:hypothetical protein n=1 Tax=Kitasatospora sp. NBC_01287 TaxID=2903573 RepID=UPI002252D454|nr:hypothetical protein [Kitasatospora sp. NBC_01287]MCX4748428.1 hypothetical protein [Kitasatospora sp. NBC_01287]
MFACPRCAHPIPARHLDRDLPLCPACRSRLREELTDWLRHLLGLGALAELTGEPR